MLPVNEICGNEADDNCDGAVDEGFDLDGDSLSAWLYRITHSDHPIRKFLNISGRSFWFSGSNKAKPGSG